MEYNFSYDTKDTAVIVDNVYSNIFCKFLIKSKSNSQLYFDYNV